AGFPPSKTRTGPATVRRIGRRGNSSSVAFHKAAGAVLTAKQASHRPGIAPALGLRAGGGCSHRSQTAFQNEVPIMAFLFFRNCRQQRPARLKRSFVPRLEGLEDRTVLSTLTVLNNLDSGLGSLRAAIADASSGDTIRFAPSLNGQTITLTSGELAISKNLDIEGPGASLLAVSGNDASRVFDISKRLTVTLAGLTITHGSADHGGGILNGAGASLIVRAVALSNNRATGGLGGGAIFNDVRASLSIGDSSLTNNQANTAMPFTKSKGGGGGGAIFNASGATL